MTISQLKMEDSSLKRLSPSPRLNEFTSDERKTKTFTAEAFTPLTQHDMTLPNVPLLSMQPHTASALTLHSLAAGRRPGSLSGQHVFDRMGLCEDAFGLFRAVKMKGGGGYFRGNGVYLVVWVGPSFGD